jgi:copper chaperone
MTTMTLNVPDISCDHCKSSIEGAVAELSGIEKVEVHIDAKTVDVAFDEAMVQRDAIVGAIEDQGYDVAS